MEKQISELDENEIASMIFEKVDAYWGSFPNLWGYVTKEDMAAAAAIDLYKPRKDGVPNILYYHQTSNGRSLKPLIGLVTYNVLMHEARYIHSTGIYNNEARRNVFSPVSLNKLVGKTEKDDTYTELMDLIPDSNVSIVKEADYVLFLDEIPDYTVENVYYKLDNGKYISVSYKSIIQYIIDGYNITQIGERLYKQSKQGEIIKFRNVNELVKKAKSYIKEYLQSEYNYNELSFKKGETLIWLDCVMITFW